MSIRYYRPNTALLATFELAIKPPFYLQYFNLQDRLCPKESSFHHIRQRILLHRPATSLHYGFASCNMSAKNLAQSNLP